MKKIWKGYLLGVLSCFILFGMAGFAGQNMAQKAMKVLFREAVYGLKNQSGKVQNAIIFENQVYVPAESFAKILGYGLKTDMAAGVLHIQDKESQGLGVVAYEGDLFFDAQWQDGGIQVAGQSYLNEHTLLSYAEKDMQRNQVYLNVGKKYQIFEAKVGIDDASKASGERLYQYVILRFYGDGKFLAEEKVLKHEGIKTIQVDIRDKDNLRIEIEHRKAKLKLNMVEPHLK